MASRLVIDGNSVYEIDEECEKRQGSAAAKSQKNSRNGSYAVPQEKPDSGR